MIMRMYKFKILGFGGFNFRASSSGVQVSRNLGLIKQGTADARASTDKKEE